MFPALRGAPATSRPRAPRSPKQTKRLPTLCVRRDTAVVAWLKTPCSTTHVARETDQPCRRKSSEFLGKNCAVSSQIVAAFRSAEIGDDHPKWFVLALSAGENNMVRGCERFEFDASTAFWTGGSVRKRKPIAPMRP